MLKSRTYGMDCAMLDLMVDGEEPRSQCIVFRCQNGGKKDVADTVIDSKAGFVPGVEG